MRTKEEIEDMILNTTLGQRLTQWSQIGFVNGLLWCLGNNVEHDDKTEHQIRKKYNI